MTESKLLSNISLVNSWSQIDDLAGANMFIGVGVTTSKELSGGELPFDILGMFLVAEKIRRLTNMNKVFVLLADEHAVTNKTNDRKEVMRVSKIIHERLGRIINNFALSHFSVIRPGDIHDNDLFKKVMFSEHPYLDLEVADSIKLVNDFNVRLKLGWSLERNSRVGGNDERFFDREISEKCPRLGFIHIKPGRSFDPGRPKASPYVFLRSENRVLLNKGEDARARLSGLNKTSVSFKGCVKHLKRVVREFESIFGKLPLVSFEDKVQFLVDKSVA